MFVGYGFYCEVFNWDDCVVVFDVFWGCWLDFESMFGVMLNGEVQVNVVMVQVCNYDNMLQYFLFGDNILEDVYCMLVQVMNDWIDVLYCYFCFCVCMFEIDDLGYYDIYFVMVEMDLSFLIDEMCEYVLVFMVLFGLYYIESFVEVLLECWMYVYL